MIRIRFPNRVSRIAAPILLAAGLAAAAAAPKPGAPAPGFELPDLVRAKSTVSLKSLAGNVVIVDFWASWCPPCHKTLPQLGRLRIRNPSLVVLAVSVDDDRSKALEFLPRNDTSLVYLHDAKKSAAAAYDLGGMPSLYLIDKKGVLRYRYDGYTEGDVKKMEEQIKKLTGESG